MHRQGSTTPIEESLRAFDDLLRSGEVRYIGASNFMAWRLMKALAASDGHGCERFVAAQYLKYHNTITWRSQNQVFLNRKTAKPQNRKTAEPRNRRTAEPQNRKTEKPQNRRTAKPKNRKTAEPQNRRTAEP